MNLLLLVVVVVAEVWIGVEVVCHLRGAKRGRVTSGKSVSHSTVTYMNWNTSNDGG